MIAGILFLAFVVVMIAQAGYSGHPRVKARRRKEKEKAKRWQVIGKGRYWEHRLHISKRHYSRSQRIKKNRRRKKRWRRGINKLKSFRRQKR